MLPFLREQFGNASSRHEYGTAARKAVNRAREQVGALIRAEPGQLVFTSGGTESNNAFMKGAAGMLKPSQAAVSAIEHPCVAKPAQELARAGWKVRRLAVDSDGRIDLDDVAAALATPTGLVSVMLANNETGVIQDVAAVAEKARAARAWMHTDAVQALGKIDVDFTALNVHAMTLSAHKIYGPKGVGALAVDKRIELKPLIAGGGHERGMRSGTENVPAIVGFGAAAEVARARSVDLAERLFGLRARLEQGLRSGTENVAGIVGFGAACELAMQRMNELAPRLAAMRDQLERGLGGLGAVVFGAGAPRIPNTSYFALPGIEGETLVIELDKAGYAVASGAACSSASTEPSATLLAMGVTPELARGAVRFSLGKDNTPAQVRDFLGVLSATAHRLRRLTALAV